MDKNSINRIPINKKREIIVSELKLYLKNMEQMYPELKINEFHKKREKVLIKENPEIFPFIHGTIDHLISDNILVIIPNLKKGEDITSEIEKIVNTEMIQQMKGKMTHLIDEVLKGKHDNTLDLYKLIP